MHRQNILFILYLILISLKFLQRLINYLSPGCWISMEISNACNRWPPVQPFVRTPLRQMFVKQYQSVDVFIFALFYLSVLLTVDRTIISILVCMEEFVVDQLADTGFLFTIMSVDSVVTYRHVAQISWWT